MAGRCLSSARAPRAALVRTAASCALLAFNFLSTLAAADLTIRHDPPACFLAEAFPRLEARVEPAAQAARVRVTFRPEAASLWHAVVAQADGDRFTVLLPRPRLAARRIHYRFHATGSDAAAASSPEYTAEVVADGAACAGRVADSGPSARVLVEVPPGAPMVPPVPKGFDPVGAVSSAPHRGTRGRKLGLLAGLVGGGMAVTAGVVAAKSEPPPLLQPTLRVNTSTPPLFSEVSISRGSMSAEIAVVSPRTLPPGQAWIVFHNQANPPERPCAVLSGSHPQIEAGREGRFVVTTPFLTATPCGLASFARALFRNGSGQQILASGSADFPDASVAYTFVP